MKINDVICNSKILLLKKYFSPYKKYFIRGMIFILLTSLTQVSLPYLFGKLVDGTNNETTGIFTNINTTAILIFLLFLLNSVFKAIKSYFFSIFAERSSINIMNQLFSKLMKNPVKFYDTNLVGELFSRITTDVSAFRNIFSEQIATVLYQPIIIIVCVTILFTINVKLTLLLIVVFPIAVFLSINMGEKIRKLSKETYDHYASANVILEESLQLIRTIKTFNTEDKEENKYKMALDKIAEKSISVALSRIYLETMASFTLLISLIIIIWYASFLVSSDQITIGKLIEFIINTVFIGSALSAITMAYGMIQKTSGATEKIKELLEELSEDISPYNEANNIVFSSSIGFNGICFNYPTRLEAVVLNKLSLNINKGEKIGIIGESGGGKSTITQLLLRFYEPTLGIIKIDGKDIKELPLSNYRRIFGVVSQEIKLFSGTIRDNILYGSKNATEEELVEACKVSNSYGFISKLPDGLDSNIGDNGVTLSGGQRQRIAIARALILNPQVLILDEATSALDTDSEAIINERLIDRMQGKTIIVLSHKLSIISKMDKLFKIEDGKIVEFPISQIQ